MLRSAKSLKGFAIGAKDGDIGEAYDFIFDDKNWTVRYVVADTQRWLPGRKVLISPIIVDQADWEGKRLPVPLTQEQVKNSPDINIDERLSALDEVKYYDYYGLPYYWVGDQVWGPVNLPSDLVREGAERKIALTHEINDSHLRSMNEVSGYAIQATDGEIGHVDDFIVDDEPWIIRYIVVDTRNFWPGKKILVAALDDRTALGAKEVIEATGRTDDCVIISQGLDRSVHGGMHDKKEISFDNRGSIVLGSVAFYLDRYGYDVLPLALRILRREAVPAQTKTKHMLVTPMNVFREYPPLDMN